MQFESKWDRIRRQTEEARKQELEQLENKLHDKESEAEKYRTICQEHRVIFQEILAICAQEHFKFLEPKERLERIVVYARKAMASE